MQLIVAALSNAIYSIKQFLSACPFCMLLPFFRPVVCAMHNALDGTYFLSIFHFMHLNEYHSSTQHNLQR